MEEVLSPRSVKKLREREYEIPGALGLMAFEASLNVGLRIPTPIGAKASVFPLAVSKVLRVLDAPARTFLHHDDPIQAAPDQAAVGVLHELALLVQQRFESWQAEHCPIWQGLTWLEGLESLRVYVGLPKFLEVGLIQYAVQHVGLVSGKGNLFRTRRSRRGNDEKYGDGGYRSTPHSGLLLIEDVKARIVCHPLKSSNAKALSGRRRSLQCAAARSCRAALMAC